MTTGPGPQTRIDGAFPQCIIYLEAYKSVVSRCVHEKTPTERTGLTMKRKLAVITLFALFAISACASRPAMKSEFLEQGIRDVSPVVVAQNPGLFEGKLFILGGIIENTSVSDEGTVIQAVDVPVVADGRPESALVMEGRYLAVWPRANGALDPAVYGKDKYISLAGYFTGLREKTPVFQIAQIRIWKKPDIFTPPPPPYYPYYAPYYYTPYAPYRPAYPYWWPF